MRPFRVHGSDLGTSSLVLAGLTLFVGAVYVAIVLGGGALIGRTDSPQLGLSILATSLVAFGFARVQRRLQRWAGSLLRGGRPSPSDVLSAFSTAVGGIYAADQVAPRMARVLAEGIGAQWSQVWLHLGGRLTLAASWPSDADADPAPPSGQEQPGVRVLPVKQAGEQLGVLRVRQSPNRPMTAVEEKLFAGLAGHAGLV